MMNSFALGLMLSLITMGSPYAVEITQVYHNPAHIYPEKNEGSDIHFTISDKSRVVLKIYDDRNLLIRTIEKSLLPGGEHSISWDGKDEAGNYVPEEAYHYVLVAQGSTADTAIYDLTDLTGGEKVRIKDIEWNNNTNYFEYTLKKPTRVLLRVGLKNDGPLLVTVTNWLPRGVGSQKEKWDGMDVSHVLDLSNHPELEISAYGYTLSKNTIIVGDVNSRTDYIPVTWESEKRQKQKMAEKRMIAAQQQEAETRGDYEATLSLPDGLPVNEGGLPVISGIVPVTLSVDQDKINVAINQRAEPVFFVDGQFAFENEVGFLPMTWLLDANKLNQGEHYLTTNVRGYEGNFGLATLKVFVRH